MEEQNTHLFSDRERFILLAAALAGALASGTFYERAVWNAAYAVEELEKVMKKLNVKP